MREISRDDWLRLAAFIDGEGGIGIHAVSHGPGQAQDSVHHVLRIKISNTDARLMVWLKERFGGSVHWADRKLPGRKRIFAWEVSAKKAEVLLLGCLDFLLLKREQADLGLALRATFKGANTKKLSENLAARRNEIHSAIHILNRRGEKVA